MRKTKRFLTLLLAITIIINPIFYNIEPLDKLLCNEAFAYETYKVYTDDSNEALDRAYYYDDKGNMFSAFYYYNSNILRLSVSGEDTLNYQNYDRIFDAKLMSEFINKYKSSIVEIELGMYVTGITDNAFKNCPNLNKITFDENYDSEMTGGRIIAIGDSAFYGCDNLKTIKFIGYDENVIPAYVKIGNRAFYGCKSIENIKINSYYIGNTAFAECDGLVSVDLGNVTNIKDSSKNYFESFVEESYTDLNTNKSCTITADNIGQSAFFSCNKLQTVTLPSNNDSNYIIGNSAFRYCNSLTSINNLSIYNGKFSSYVFGNCTSLKSVNLNLNFSIDNSYNYYTKEDNENYEMMNAFLNLGGRSLFENCKKLENVSVTTTNNCNELPNSIFRNCELLQNVDLTNAKISSIGSGAFSGCSSLKSIGQDASAGLRYYTAENMPLTINSYAFGQCTSLDSVYLYDTVVLSDYAFTYCTSLKEIEIPSATQNVTGFDNCTSLSKVTFRNGDKVKSISDKAFTGCTSLSSIDLRELTNLESIDGFNNSGISSIFLPDNVKKIENTAFLNCSMLTSFVIPKECKAIGDSAFANCINLMYVSNDSALETVGNNAFIGCTNLKGFDFNNSIVSIGESAFENCTSITNIDLSNVNEKFSILENKIFNNCTSLSKITLPSGITTIKNNIFDNTAVNFILLGNDISNISNDALRNFEGTIITSNEVVKHYCDVHSLKKIYLSIDLENILSEKLKIEIDLDNLDKYKNVIEEYNVFTEEQRTSLEQCYGNAASKISLIESALSYIEKNKELLQSDKNNIDLNNVGEYNELYSRYTSLSNSIKTAYSNKLITIINDFYNTAKKYNFIKDYTNLLSSEAITLSYNPLEIDNALSKEDYNNFNSKYSELTEIDKEFVENYFTKLNIGSIINYINKGESFLTKYQDILDTDETIVIDETNKDRFTELVQEYMNITSNSKIVFSDKITEKIKDLQDYFKKDALVKEIDSFVESNGSTETSVSTDNMEEIITLSAMYENLTEEEKTEITNQYPDLQIDNISKIGDFLSNTTGSQMYCDLINKTSDEMTVENSDDFKNMLNDFSGLTDEVKNMFSEAIKTNVEQLIQKYNELNVFTVTFIDGILILKKETVSRGNGATAPVVNDKSGFKFVGWDKDFNNITGNLTVNALWKEEPTTTEPVETTTEQKPEETTKEQTTTKPEETTTEQKPEETTTEQKPEETTKEQTTTKPEETTTEQKPEETTKEQTTTKPGETPTEQPTTSSVEPENSIKNAVISLQYKSTTYDGTQKKPTVTVKNKNGAALKNGTDYSITYRNNINVGTASVVITGKGNYTSSVTMNFKISQASISKATAILKYISVGYSGSAKKPSVTVKLSNKTLKKNTDYKVTYSNNVNAGTASVKISGINNYKGTKTKQFTITKLNIAKASVKLKYTSTVYDGKTKKPSATVKYGKKTLKLNKDYKISYKNNKNVGIAYVYITGKGNYQGTKFTTFKIKAQSMKKAKVKLQYSKITYSQTMKKPKVSIAYGKNKLKENKDYVVLYSNNINVGKAKVTITGRGNYSGSITKTFSITPKSLSSSGVKATLSYTSTEYNGVAKTPFVTVYDKNTFVGNSNFRCTYENNNQIGTAKVTITGMGNYTGTITKNFTINPTKTYISSVNINGTEITLKWDIVAGVSGYELSFKRAADNTWQTMETTNTTQSMFATVIAGSTQYDFRVRSFSSVNGAKYYSDYSLVKSVMVTG